MKAKVLVGLAALGSVSIAQAQLSCDASYGVRVDANAVTGALICSNKSSAFIDAINNLTLSNPSYSDTAAAVILGRFNDVGATMQYLGGSTTLAFSFPQIGAAGSFTGATRRESQSQFVDYLKKNDILGQILNYQAKNSPTSAITGVGGMIPNAVNGEFNASFTDTATRIASPMPQGATSATSTNLIGVGIAYGSYSVDGNRDRVNEATIPLSYTIRNDLDPRRQLVFSAPLSMVDIGGAKTYSGSLGATYRLPLTDNWTIAPGARYGVTASDDRGTVASLYTASIASIYQMEFSGFDIAIGNMVAYNKTGKFSSGDYAFDPNISNTALRNGVLLSHPVMIGGSKYSLEYSLIDTRYFGDKPFTDNTQELGVTIGTNKSAYDARSFVRAGLGVMHGKGVDGYMLKVNYWF